MMRVSTGVFWRMKLVHLGLDLGQFFGRHRLGMAEIETQPVGRVQRAALRDMIAKRAAQRLVQQVGGRVVGADRAAAVVIDRSCAPCPRADRAQRDLGHMDEQPAGFAVSVTRTGAGSVLIRPVSPT
jgi:hypothetical protein